jgi:hypothetical protein
MRYQITLIPANEKERNVNSMVDAENLGHATSIAREKFTAGNLLRTSDRRYRAWAVSVQPVGSTEWTVVRAGPIGR